MATFIASKVVAALPDPLVANTVYFVRVRTGFDVYLVDSTGTIAYKSNAALGSEVSALTNSAGTEGFPGRGFVSTTAANPPVE
jgi:hypothetical protein